MTNIPKKLDKLSSTEEIVVWLNELRDYLQAKEDKSYKVASSVCCDSSFRLEGDTKEGTMFHVCNNCNKACDLKLTQKEVEASKGDNSLFNDQKLNECANILANDDMDKIKEASKEEILCNKCGHRWSNGNQFLCPNCFGKDNSTESKGEFKPLKLKPEDIAGEYDYKVDIKNSLPIPKEEKCDCPRCNPPEHPDMECSCGEMIKDGYACSKCREINMGNRKIVTVDLTPPEHEEEWEKRLGSYLSDRGDKPILNDYIRDNFVSKEKIKREIDKKIEEIRDTTTYTFYDFADDLLNSLGLGD